MAVSKINIDTDAELRTKVQSVLDDLGLDIPTAVNIFFKQIVYKDAIPFEISRPKPANTNKPNPGGWEGKIFMSDDFNEPMEELFEDYV